MPFSLVESRSPHGVQTPKKDAQWSPPASKSYCAKSCVSGVPACKRLIFLKWHGRGREFESHQVHHNVSNTYRFPASQERNHRSPTGVQKPKFSMGSLGHRVDFAPAHDLAFGFNAIARLGTIGTIFHAWCSPETTKTFGFLIRMLPTWPRTRDFRRHEGRGA